jgi:hypothetical protein
MYIKFTKLNALNILQSGMWDGWMIHTVLTFYPPYMAKVILDVYEEIMSDPSGACPSMVKSKEIPTLSS